MSSQKATLHCPKSLSKAMDGLFKYRTIVKSAYRKTNFLISQPKHML